MGREEKKVVESVLVNNRMFDWKVALLRRRIYNYKMKEHMMINNGKMEDNDYMMKSMEQVSKIFSRSFHNKNSGKGDIITDTKYFQQTMLMAIIHTPDFSKKINSK